VRAGNERHSWKKTESHICSILLAYWLTVFEALFPVSCCPLWTRSALVTSSWRGQVRAGDVGEAEVGAAVVNVLADESVANHPDRALSTLVLVPVLRARDALVTRVRLARVLRRAAIDAVADEAAGTFAAREGQFEAVI
jgi:hypothetical protein